jgi:hypothetical protein
MKTAQKHAGPPGTVEIIRLTFRSLARRRCRRSSVTTAATTTARAAIWQAADELAHVLALHGAHKKPGPERSNLHTRSLRNNTPASRPFTCMTPAPQ